MGNRVFFGSQAPPKLEEVKRMENTFPWESNLVMGLLFDWKAMSSSIPSIFLPLISNPFGLFEKIHAKYRKKDGELVETTTLLSRQPIDQGFMKTLAEDLFVYKILLLRFGIDLELRIEASKECLRISTTYKGLSNVLHQIRKYLWIPLAFLKSKVHEKWCSLRRILFNGSFSELSKICPEGDGVIMDPVSGSLICSIHKDRGVFPFIASSIDRCFYSRKRIEGIMKILLPYKDEKKSENELIQRVVLDYNISPCPTGGILESEAPGGRVTCTFHDKHTSQQK
ncbi:hypothetical protein HYY75_08950 [bacterium]|nr:hypothetical protein [bacterium]